MRRLLAWCERRGLTVEISSEPSHYDIEARTIHIQRASKTSMLHSLLHECGHALLDRQRARKWPNGYARFPAPRALSHGVECLAEEIEAWERGARLARRLALRIDWKRFRRARDSAVASYARHL